MSAEVTRLGSDEIESLRPLVTEYPYLFDGQYLGEVPQESLADVFLRRSARELYQGTQSALVWKEGDKVAGVASVQQLGWDSRHFGISMARLELLPGSELGVSAMQDLVRSALRLCAEQGIAHLASRVSLGAQTCLEALAGCGFRPVGVKLTLRYAEETAKATDVVSHVRIRSFELGDAQRVRELARMAVTDSRFYRDGRFNSCLIEGLYEGWVERTWKAGSGQVLVAIQGAAVVGFIACDLEIPAYGLGQEDLGGVKSGFVGLVAVDPGSRGAGIGRKLINEGVGRLSQEGCRVVYANVMLSNETSVNAFFKAGFALKGAVQEFHLWL